jgi:hypothetical protein
MFDVASVCHHRFEKGCLYAGCAAKSPQQARQSKHQLALYRRLGVIVGNRRGFEGLVNRRVSPRPYCQSAGRVKPLDMETSIVSRLLSDRIRFRFG